MKRIDLIRPIEKHDQHRIPVTGLSQPVPRHRQIKRGLSRHIIKMLSDPAEGLSSSQSPEDSSP
jgi:mRNA interferase HicA